MVFSREFPHSFLEALRVSRQILSSNHDLVRKNAVDPESELVVMGAHFLATGEKLSRSDLFFRINDRIPESSAEKIFLVSSQRANGKPLQQILGFAHFLSHEYQVSPDVLIPRPETEVLVAEALKILLPLRPALGIEIGLGSGVISIELLKAIAGLKMIASEISPAAVQIAQTNALAILKEHSSNLSVFAPGVSSEVMNPFLGGAVGPVDFIISNPPYLDPRDAQSEADTEVLRYEPRVALFSENPLYFYQEIARDSVQLLKRGGYVFLEIASERAQLTRGLFSSDRWQTLLVRDLNGRERVLIAMLK